MGMRTMTLPCGERLTFEELGNWTDDPCFYVSVVDGPKHGLLAGPYRTHEEALAAVDTARDADCAANDWAWFYSYGTVKMANGHRQGVLNDVLGV